MGRSHLFKIHSNINLYPVDLLFMSIICQYRYLTSRQFSFAFNFMELLNLQNSTYNICKIILITNAQINTIQVSVQLNAFYVLKSIFILFLLFTKFPPNSRTKLEPRFNFKVPGCYTCERYKNFLMKRNFYYIINFIFFTINNFNVL
jgi:hypothetical protein